MAFVALVFAGCAVAIATWFALLGFSRGWVRYREVFQHETRLRLEEFFLFLNPRTLWALNILSCVCLFALVYAFSRSLWLGGVAALVGMFAPRVLLGRIKRRRLTRFEQQLPDFLLALASALRAGSAIQPALRHLVKNFPSPLGQEFNLLLREQRMGVSFEQALAQLYQRMPTEGMGLLMAALNIALQSGGNLAETLEGIASTLRERLHLIARVKALTSQGRMQAWVMAALPLLLLFVLNWLEPEAMALLWQSWPGRAVLALVCVLEVVGLLLIRRIVLIDV